MFYLQKIYGSKPIVRVAYEIGSNKIKMQVALMDKVQNILIKILCQDVVSNPLAEDLNENSGRLSHAMQLQTISHLKNIQEKAQAYRPLESSGVATGAARLASNQESFVENVSLATGIPLKLITSEEEGALAFLSATCTLSHDPASIVCWDSGAMSLQMTFKEKENYLVYHKNLGKVPLNNLLLAIQGKRRGSPNPVSKENADQLSLQLAFLFQDIPDSLVKRLQSDKVKVIKKGTHPLGGTPLNFTAEMVEANLSKFLNLSDREIEDFQSNNLSSLKLETSYLISSLVITSFFCKKFNIKKIDYSFVGVGNTNGILLTQKFWKE